MAKDKFKQFLERKIIMKGQAGFKVMTYRFVTSPLGVNNYKKLNLILLFISLGSTQQYGGVPYHLNVVFVLTIERIRERNC